MSISKIYSFANMDYAHLIPFVLVSITLTLTPGPDILYVLSTSLRFGFKTAFFLAFGLCSGLVIHTLLVGFGVSEFILENENILLIIKLFGSCYMLYIAYVVFRDPAKLTLSETHQPDRKIKNFYFRGLLMNVLNPKVTLFFLAFLPQFITIESGRLMQQAFLLGTIFFIQALVIFSIIAFYASQLSQKIQGNAKIEQLLKFGQIGIFVFLSLSILFF